MTTKLEQKIPPLRGGAAGLPAMAQDINRDAYRGALIGTAIGDALGRPAEGSRHAWPDSERERFSEFQRWRGWQRGPEGTITDDTQMTMCVAESLCATGGVLNPDDLAKRFVDWLPVGRGKGATCVKACQALTAGRAWEDAGIDSAGNGAAMRTAPIGLVNVGDLDALRRDAAMSAWITHANPMAVVSAIAHAWAVARLVSTEAGTLDAEPFIADLCDAIDDLYDPGEVDREWQTRGLSGQPVRLVDRISEVPHSLDRSREDAGDHFYCGAFVLESLPMALWHFLNCPDNPERAIVNATMGGFDADTVASMTGAYVGAYLGESALPERWRGTNLEFSNELRAMADRLLEMAVRATSH